MDKLVLKVRDFSKTPGSRYIDEGSFSGELYRDSILESKFLEAVDSNNKLIIILDGTIGYGTSWLEEVFGGLARKHDKQEVLSRLEFISDEEPYLVEDIQGYIIDA